MGKKIIVTSGPTNEKIDDVMKITNMSTGSLGATIAERIIAADKNNTVDKVYYVHSRLAAMPPMDSGKIHDVTIETTEDLMNTLRVLLRNPDERIDAVVHAAAVGDYAGRYAARAEDLAGEIAMLIAETLRAGKNPDEDGIRGIVLNTLTDPTCVQDRNAKISSYEPNLMVMLGLTPKVIGHIKKWSPNTKLIGFKLLDHVPQDELLRVAGELRKKNNADYIVANDLSKIYGGHHWALIVGENGVITECVTKQEIAAVIADVILEN